MKQFFKMMFACLAAIVLAGAMSMFFFVVMLGALAASGTSGPVVPDRGLLVFDVSANISDAPGGDPAGAVVAGILGEAGPPRLQLRKVIDAIDRAAADERIQGLLVHGSFEASGLGSGYGALLEVRTALERFRGTGKPVIAYLVTPSTRDYMVASIADRIVLHPMGQLMTPGLNSEVIYWGGLFAKYGIGVQIARAGSFKSFGETYAQDEMSEQQRQQLTELLDDVWAEFIASVTRSRKLDEGALQRIIDEAGFISANAAREAGLVDELREFPDLLAELKTMTGETDPEETFKQISIASYIALHDFAAPAEPAGPLVAVAYAEGDIVDGEGALGLVGGDKLARELRELRNDGDVKAVVVRVNSPGGSAVASEVIRGELARLREVKPVVISMGSMAASGGYWIATGGDRIFAEPTTITGSIGVVAVLPNVQGLAERFSVNIESVKTGQHADIFSIAKPRSPETMAVIQGLITEVYTAFIDRVSASRNLTREQIEAVAGGRVWSGADALRHGLVDEIGGLDRAIAHAAALAKLDEYTVIDFPPPEDFLKRVLDSLSGRTKPLAARVRGGALDDLDGLLGQLRALAESLNDPTGVYARLPYILRLN